MTMRRKPYTARGLTRCKCRVPGCKEKARFQWETPCAVGAKYVALCHRHDFELNRVTLEFVLGVETATPIIEAYRRT